MSKGGFVAFRGSSDVAAAYLAGHIDIGGAGTAANYLAAETTPFQYGAVGIDGIEVDRISRDDFRLWAEHVDPATGESRSQSRSRTLTRIGDDGQVETKTGGTPLYQETTVSSSKSLSLAAAANPAIWEALEAAMERATVSAARAFHEHAVTRVGPRGAQEQVKFDRIEFTSVQHHTSRSGDPHMHRHVQFLSRGLVTLEDGRQVWRAVDGAVLYRMAERIHAAADLTLATDPELRRAIADAGYTWVPGEGGGRIAEFEALTDEFSQRREQIAARRETVEAQWRAEHPGQEPSARLVRQWDNHSWSATRPEKHELAQEERDDQAARLATAVPTNTGRKLFKHHADEISPEIIAQDAVARLSTTRSAWSTADMKAAIDRRLAETYLLGDVGLDQLREAAMQAARRELVNFFDEGIDIEGTYHWTSKQVLATDQAIEESLRGRAQTPGQDGEVKVDRGGFVLSDGQAAAARSVTGTHKLVVIEGAAGTGKTTMLSAANEEIVRQGRRIVAISPTKRGALEMAREIGIQGNSVHGMLVQAGASFDDNGNWQLPKEWRRQPEVLTMDEKTVLVVDEVGMLDMGTAAALHRYCDDTGVQLVLLGDRKQLAAVGRGGYLTKAVHVAAVTHDLRDVRRFRTPDGRGVDREYADASLELRERRGADEFFELLENRGQVQIGETEQVVSRVAENVALEIDAGQSSIAVAATNAVANRINSEVYKRLVASGTIDDAELYHQMVEAGEALPGRRKSRLAAPVVEGREGDRIAKGAKVATRLNDRETQVANRQTWVVDKVNRDGRVIVKDEESGFRTTLSKEYVRDNLQLAYAVTAHGAQGMTVDTAHTLVSEQMDAAGTYVGLTRGRRANVLHAVAVDIDDAKAQFVEAVGRSRADLGLDGARAEAEVALHSLVEPATQLAPGDAVKSDAPAAAAQPIKPAELAKPKVVQQRVKRQPRVVDTIAFGDLRDNELVAVVHQSDQRGARVEFQLSAASALASEMSGLNLRADETADGRVATAQTLTADQHQQLIEAAGAQHTTVHGRQVYAVRADLVARRDGRSGYAVDVASAKPSQSAPIDKSVLDRQRQSEDAARQRAVERHEKVFAAAQEADRVLEAASQNRERGRGRA